MRWNEAFINTLREDPTDAELTSHKLMTRAGMIQKVAAGIYNYLPLGLRVIRKVENIIREEMKNVGSAELLMPSVVPADLWKESGRWQQYGQELLRIKDRKDNEFCLGPTHEEVIVDIARKAVSSYRDMPLSLFQIQSKFRDERRPRFGLMRGREFIMKDAYSFHTSEESLDETYWVMHAAYTRIFEKFGLEFRPVQADSGTIGGDVTHEFHVLADSGEDKIIYCDTCDYAANVEKAEAFVSKEFASYDAKAASPEVVETPGKKKIEEVAKFLEVTPADTIKMVVYVVDEKLVGVLVRGDLDCNEIKLKNHLGAIEIESAEDKYLGQSGFAVGYMGPINLEGDIKIVADYSLMGMDKAVIGANIKGSHMINVIPARDLADLNYADLSFADEGDTCCCGGKLHSCRGIEVGQVFKLGTKYTKSMGMTYSDQDGNQKTPTMGCYGIGVGRTAAAAVEQNSDDHGIIWPVEIAPYAVSVLCLDPGNEEALALAKGLHDSLEMSGLDVLLDDRDERPGIKFKDHDLIGVPVQIVIGARGLKNGELELKTRTDGEKQMIAIDQALEMTLAVVEGLKK